MLLKNLMDPHYDVVEIDDVELKIKKLNWKELKAFEAKATSLGVENTDGDLDSTISLVEYVFINFIRDSDGEVPIAFGKSKAKSDKPEIEYLPVSFCVKVLNTFVEKVKTNDTEIKKN